MKKFRIVEARVPLNWYYAEGIAEEPPKDVKFSKPSILLEGRKSIFHKWRPIKYIDSILEAEYYIYNEKVQKVKPLKKVIKKL